jgi:hypothetical protein
MHACIHQRKHQPRPGPGMGDIERVARIELMSSPPIILTFKKYLSWILMMNDDSVNGLILKNSDYGFSLKSPRKLVQMSLKKGSDQGKGHRGKAETKQDYTYCVTLRAASGHISGITLLINNDSVKGSPGLLRYV